MALEAELSSSKQETMSVKADAEILVKEAGMAADKKVIRLTERTAKVMLLSGSTSEAMYSRFCFYAALCILLRH